MPDPRRFVPWILTFALGCVPSTELTDADGDGFFAEVDDCDDSTGAVYPAAPERCDLLDNDCDQQIDENVRLTFYVDADGDGAGDPDRPVEACEAESGQVSDRRDCNDRDPQVYPGVAERCNDFDDDCDGQTDEGVTLALFVDGDGDGFGDVPTEGCEVRPGLSTEDGDCDDALDSVHPEAFERCNLIDDDCDADVDESSAIDAGTWYLDADGDTQGDPRQAVFACAAPIGWVADARDCDDDDDTVKFGASERCNTRDDDCDGAADEAGAIDGADWYADADRDGAAGPGIATKFCADPGEGWAQIADDCDDADPLTHPGAAEDCAAADRDCDEDPTAGAVDPTAWYEDLDGDGYGSTETFACAAPSEAWVVDGGDCDEADDAVHPSAFESCNDIDDDCNGAIDDDVPSPDRWYADDDTDGSGDPSRFFDACDPPEGWVSGARDCDDQDRDIGPHAAERCGGGDEDCDGTIDEDEAFDAPSWYADGDGDGFGAGEAQTQACAPPGATGWSAVAGDCDDADPNSAARVGYVDGDSDGYGNPDQSVSICEGVPAGVVEVSGDCDDARDDVHPDRDERCNTVDDDCDGTVDLDAVDATAWYNDADGDGYGAAEAAPSWSCDPLAGHADRDDDCDDSRAQTHPDAPELCDTLDNDCDATTDEDPPDGLVRYLDRDEDGFGDVDGFVRVCDDNPALDVVGEDCAPDDPAVNPTTTWYRDGDSDGYPDISTATVSCAAPAATGWVHDPPGFDCDDANPDRNPGHVEVCTDTANQPQGVDDDCDEQTDEPADCPVFHCGTITADEAWGPTPHGHWITCDVIVSGATLEIKDTDVRLVAGARLELPGADLVVDHASLAAVDAPWAEVRGYLDSTVTMTNADVRGGGSDGAMITLAAGGTFLDSTFDESDGVAIVGEERGSVLDLQGCTFGPSLNDAIIEVAGADFGHVWGNTWSATTEVWINDGAITDATIWENPGVPLVILDDLEVDGAGADLTLGDGSTLDFAGTALRVGASTGGTLSASDAIFSGVGWQGVHFGPADGGSVLTRPALSGATTGVTVSGAADVTIVGGSLRDNQAYGALVEQGGLTLDGVAVTGNGGAGVGATGGAIALSGGSLADNGGRGFEATGGAHAITGVDITGNGGDGVSLSDAATLSADFADNLVTGNAGRPAKVTAASVGRLVASTAYAGNTDTAVAWTSDGTAIDADVTVHALDVPWLALGDLRVGGASAPVLTIEPGVSVRFLGAFGVAVGVDGPAALVAEGTSAAPIVLESGRTTPAAGDWLGVWVGPQATEAALAWATIRHGGRVRSGSDPEAGLWVQAGAVSLDHVTVTNNLTAGIVISGDGTATSLDRYASVTLRDNTGAPLALPAALVGDLSAAGNVFAPNTVDAVAVTGGTITAGAHAWPVLPVPYSLISSLTIGGAGSPFLTLDGVTVRLRDAVEIIAGNGVAGGLAIRNATLTTDGVGLATPWCGLVFGANASTGSTITTSVLEYGGKNSLVCSVDKGMVKVVSANVAITGNTIRNSASSGVLLVTSPSTVTGNSFSSYAGWAIIRRTSPSATTTPNTYDVPARSVKTE